MAFHSYPFRDDNPNVAQQLLFRPSLPIGVRVWLVPAASTSCPLHCNQCRGRSRGVLVPPPRRFIFAARRSWGLVEGHCFCVRLPHIYQVIPDLTPPIRSQESCVCNFLKIAARLVWHPVTRCRCCPSVSAKARAGVWTHIECGYLLLRTQGTMCSTNCVPSASPLRSVSAVAARKTVALPLPTLPHTHKRQPAPPSPRPCQLRTLSHPCM